MGRPAPTDFPNKDDRVAMNRTTSQRAEEARRAAQAATSRAKQAQNEILKERAATLAADAQKISNLRALRLAKEAETKDATDLAASEVSDATLLAAKEPRSKRRAAARRMTRPDAQDAVSDLDGELAATDDMESQA